VHAEKQTDAAYQRIHENKLQRGIEARCRAIDKSKEDRLLGAIFIARNFVDLRMRDIGDTAQFARAWARHWGHAARVVRQYAGIATIEGMPIPEGPSLLIAHTVFERALGRLPIPQLARELGEHLDRLGDAGGFGGAAENRFGLFLFFDALKAHLLQTAPVFREYPAQQPRPVAATHAGLAPPDEGSTDSDRKKWSGGEVLTDWKEILDAIEVPAEKRKKTQKQLRRYNDRFGGPIGKIGNKPRVDREILRDWWANLPEIADRAQAHRGGLRYVDDHSLQERLGLHSEKRPNAKGKARKAPNS
jgi:hypothetical protein